MNKLEALRVLLFAGEALGAATLVMAMAWLGASGRRASQRHLVWAAAFGALLLLPLLAAFAPPLIHLSIAAEPAPMQVVVTPLLPRSPDLIPVSDADHAFAFALLARAATALWLFGAFLVAVRAMFAGVALLRLKARSAPHRFGHLPIGGPRCTLRIANETDSCGPVTWGLWRTVILLPKESVTWPRERLDAVLRHELAHVERHDCLTQTLALIACALYWPNPLVWLGVRRLRREAEIAADDAVILSGIKPSTYASALLRIAHDFRTVSHMPLAMAAPSALEARVQSVLAPTQPRTGVTSMDAVRIACIGLAATAALAVARPSLAEETAKTQPDPIVAPNAAAAPVAPAAAETAPVAPAVNSETEVPATHRERFVVQMTDDGGGVHVMHRPLTAKEKQHLRLVVRQARAEVEAARPAIERAVREAHVAQDVMAQIKLDEPKIRLAIAEAQRVSTTEIHRALAEARAAVGREHLDQKTLASVQHALDQVEANMTKDHGDVQVEVQDDGDVDAEVKEK